MPTDHTNDLAIAEQIRDYVLTNLDQRFTAKELANQFVVSQRFIEREIPRLLGKSLADLVYEKRMQEAVILLQQGHQSKEIAKTLGYKSKSYFCIAFKKRYDCDPNIYLKKK